MAEAEVPADSIEAWALPPRERAQRRTDFSGQTVVVVARVDQRYYAARSRLPPEGVRPPGFLLWQTLPDRKSVRKGKRVLVREDLGGCCSHKKKQRQTWRTPVRYNCYTIVKIYGI